MWHFLIDEIFHTYVYVPTYCYCSLSVTLEERNFASASNGEIFRVVDTMWYHKNEINYACTLLLSFFHLLQLMPSNKHCYYIAEDNQIEKKLYVASNDWANLFNICLHTYVTNFVLSYNITINALSLNQIKVYFHYKVISRFFQKLLLRKFRENVERNQQ